MRKLVFLAVVVAFLALFPGHAHGIDTGFRPDRDGFGFANFGDPEGPGGFDLNALLGTDFHDEILCHTGHCFGMAEASVENFAGGNASILIPEAEAMPHIDRVQTGQSFYYIADFFRAPFGEKPADNAGGVRKIVRPPLDGEARGAGHLLVRGQRPGPRRGRVSRSNKRAIKRTSTSTTPTCRRRCTTTGRSR